ncbi:MULTISPECIES: VOC family protein [unclassified Modestobacter]|uniref:VOC family protein n=1 Tax=unclassified Modestobacter TaxID=2643866 RepID=UPI0022AA5D49|nr:MULTISPECIES: VOC family protein [unclassified Modestobacter]MCZ2824307.1 VOC family protein [Modestobacter sp. VKM Ac-2981]MCZ2854165.1 VOC family protein [Modestobacter sp. VKM Ac-2982]
MILTADPESLRDFYVGVLGGQVVERTPPEDDGEPPFFLNLRIGDSVLGLVREAEPPAGNRTLLGIGVDDVDALLDSVRAHGGSVTGGPTDMEWGMRVAHVSDPDGNPINLQCPIRD